jgi:shikimate dehydrogenase
MAAPYAEVIGDPIAQSKSPLIHKHWVAALGLEGDFRATHVAPAELQDFLARRRADPDWRGCNVTIPHKVAVMPLLDAIDPGAAAIGAVNCIVPAPGGLIGRNTDIDGVAAALGHVDLCGGTVALIGAGGAARAAIHYLVARGALVRILVRDPKKAQQCRSEAVEILPIEQADLTLADVDAIVNASPMGMAGGPEWPSWLLATVDRHAFGKTLFDMVYKPLETPFLALGGGNRSYCVDGLDMLIGQARAAFRLFFGADAPADDELLRDLLAT